MIRHLFTAASSAGRVTRRHGWITFFACWSMFMTVALTGKAIARFDDPFQLWMTEAPRWYDEALGATMYGIVAIACITYLRRRARDLPAPGGGDSAVRNSRWRERIELRVVLYCFAVFLAIQLPISVIATVRAMHDERSPWPRNFVSLFPIGGWICPLIGAAIVVYDRRRVIREAREDSGSCLTCGYDLRASTGRCPECGTPIQSNAESSA